MTAFRNITENAARSRAFTTIIREVSRDVQPNDYAEVRLIVERKKDGIKISRKSSRLGSVFGSPHAYYIVANDNSADNVAKGSLSCTISHTRKTDHVDVVIDYEVSCPAGQEETMLEALCRTAPNPEEALRRTIQKCVGDYARASGDEFIENYADAVEALRVAIADTVTQKTHLYCRIWISLDSEELLEPFVIQPISFGVGLKNTQDRFALSLHTVLDIDESNKAKALLKLGWEFELANLLKSTIRQYVESNISLDDLYSANFSYSASIDIAEAVNDILREYGRQISFLAIENKPVAADDSQLERIECSTSCQISKPQTFSFQMSSVLQMQLIDLGKYKQAQAPTLISWAERILARSLKNVLFKMSYIDLFSRNKEIVEGVVRYLETAAGEIGYSVNHIALTPEIGNFLLSDDFTIEISHYPFSLKERKTQVTLDVLFYLNIPNLLDIQKYLQPSINVKKSIEDHAIEIIRHHCRHISSDYFEQYFLLSPGAAESSLNEAQLDEASYELDALSVQDGLSLAVKAAIEKEFSAQVTSVLISLSA